MRVKWIGLSLGAVAVTGTAAVALAALRPAEACAVTVQGAAVPGAVVRGAAVPGTAAQGAAVRGVPAPGVGYSGQATHYELQSGGGNCSYEGPPADRLYVALSPGEYAAAGACGAYLDVTGPKGSVRVKVVDQCPECKSGQLDLSSPAFGRIAALSDGIVKIRYQLARNPRVPAALTYRIKEGSSRYWFALLPDNHANPVARLEVRSGSGGWIPLQHADYNYWIVEQGAGGGPFTVRLTDTAGRTATSAGIALRPGVVQQTGQRLGGGAAPAPRRSPSATATARPRPTPTARPTSAPPLTPSPSRSSSAAPAEPSDVAEPSCE